MLSTSPRTHWVDRLALRVAAPERRHRARSPSPVRRDPLLPPISRRRALAASAAMLAGLAVDGGREAVPAADASGVACADQAFKDCDDAALEAMDDDLEAGDPEGGLDKGLNAAVAGFNWEIRRSICARDAASRHCGPCETCDGGSGNCDSICDSNEECVNGSACARSASPRRPILLASGATRSFATRVRNAIPTPGNVNPPAVVKPVLEAPIAALRVNAGRSARAPRIAARPGSNAALMSPRMVTSAVQATAARHTTPATSIVDNCSGSQSRRPARRLIEAPVPGCGPALTLLPRSRMAIKGAGECFRAEFAPVSGGALVAEDPPRALD